jgi:hypothetical protein
MSAPSPATRPPTPAPTPTETGGGNYLEVLYRTVMVLMLVSSFGILWWSYYRVYVPRLKEYHEADAALTSLTVKVDDLDHLWSQADIEQINKRYEVLQPKVFADQPELESWLADFRDQLAPLGLNIKFDLVTTNAPIGDDRKLFPIPATITIVSQPVAGAVDTPAAYQQLLQFAKHLTAQEKSTGLTRLTVASGTNSVGRAVLNLNFWAGAKEAK